MSIDTQRKGFLKMEESRLERRLKKEIEKRGGLALKLTVPNKRGMPDRLILLPGEKIYFVEMKAPGEKPRPLQRKRAKQLQALGFSVYCLDSDEAIDDFLQEVGP